MLAPTPRDETAAQEEAALAAARQFDGHLNAAASRFTFGLSPISLGLALTDWSMHLMTQPGQAAWLTRRAHQAALGALTDTLAGTPPGEDDPRFAHPAWSNWPWAPVVHSHRRAAGWWTDASTLRGMKPHHQEVIGFLARQWMDMLAPSNLGPANPEVMHRVRESRGGSLVNGALNALDDWRQRRGLPPLHAPTHSFEPGVDVALAPGKVVHRNELVELIQYQPTTPTVDAEPVFIVPSWIMKYYILDLSPHNSMVSWLVSQGHTVFIVSWRNPDASHALLGLDDYLALGIFDTLAAIGRLVPDEPVHACGYCLGGTLLSVAAAALSRPGQVQNADHLPTLQSVTLLAAETDFSEPGEMGVLIDEAQVALLEDLMAERGFLSGPQMAGSFTYLHSRDLFWSQKNRELWLGEPNQPNDLMAWNADVTRMPAQMHSEYLRRCYLHNEIAEGRFPVEGRPVSLNDVHLPMFVVGTEKDHVSPWKSVYKLHHLTDTELTFVLTSGGHNAGIVSEPGHPHRHYAMHTRASGAPWQDPQQWRAVASRHEGSWWPAWKAWLSAQGSGRKVPARVPAQTEVLGDAPGEYVHQRYAD